MKKYLYIFIPLLLFFILSSDVFAKDINEIQFKFDYIEDVKQQIAEHSEKWMAYKKGCIKSFLYSSWDKFYIKIHFRCNE